LTQQHSDQRRTISEAVIEGADGQVERITQLNINPGRNELGHHFHLNGPEEFHLAAGDNVLLLLQDTQGDGPVTRQVLNAPARITIPPGVAHTFIVDGPAILISKNQGRFDPNDMHAHPLQDPAQTHPTW
jgi:hypothetical protein